MSGSATYISLPELQQVLGHELADCLLSAFGGERLYVPQEPGPDHKITGAIGEEGAKLLAADIATGTGGMWVELPIGRTGAFAAFRERLREAAADPALKAQDVASMLRVHPRTVRRMRARLREEAAKAQRKAEREPGQMSGAR